MGNLGNRMIQYLAAVALAARVPGARLAQIHLPEWGIQVPPLDGAGARIAVARGARLDLGGLAEALNAGAVDRVDIRSYAQRIDNFLGPEAYRDLFRGPDLPGAGPDELLVNIRQGDILDGHHPDYVLIPIDFYAELVAQTGLAPVFLGQLESSPYMRSLKRRFPGARFVPSRGAVADFAAIRASRHIVPAISTFSWLAAWLSEAERIFMPVLGQLNPMQARSADLLPLDDARIRFTLFPHHYAVPVRRQKAAHAALRGLWRMVPPARLRALLAADPPPRDRSRYCAAFDEGDYLSLYPDIAASVRDGHMPSGRHHYEMYGFGEGRTPFRLDAGWYCRRYPIAAVELSQNEAHDPIDHWICMGADRGYARVPR
jgi:hypothetical protein